MRDSTKRFSDRVENYVKYRPTYPSGVIETLKSKCGLSDHSMIADVGSGTGILTRLFLDNGNQVFAVEPNDEMRNAAEEFLGGYSRFTSVNAVAEKTALETVSVDFVVAGQAFHWFDAAKSKSEFQRILRSDGWAVLIWNGRQLDSTPFLRDYESLLMKYAIDYRQVNHMNVGDDVLTAFFGPNSLQTQSFPNVQTFDYNGLEGRCLSSSYAPNIGEPGHEAMIDALKKCFEKHEKGGVVHFDYKTEMYFAQLNIADMDAGAPA